MFRQTIPTLLSRLVICLLVEIRCWLYICIVFTSLRWTWSVIQPSRSRVVDGTKERRSLSLCETSFIVVCGCRQGIDWLLSWGIIRVVIQHLSKVYVLLFFWFDDSINIDLKCNNLSLMQHLFSVCCHHTGFTKCPAHNTIWVVTWRGGKRPHILSVITTLWFHAMSYPQHYPSGIKQRLQESTHSLLKVKVQILVYKRQLWGDMLFFSTLWWGHLFKITKLHQPAQPFHLWLFKKLRLKNLIFAANVCQCQILVVGLLHH